MKVLQGRGPTGDVQNDFRETWGLGSAAATTLPTSLDHCTLRTFQVKFAYREEDHMMVQGFHSSE